MTTPTNSRRMTARVPLAATWLLLLLVSQVSFSDPRLWLLPNLAPFRLGRPELHLLFHMIVDTNLLHGALVRSVHRRARVPFTRPPPRRSAGHPLARHIILHDIDPLPPSSSLPLGTCFQRMCPVVPAQRLVTSTTLRGTISHRRLPQEIETATAVSTMAPTTCLTTRGLIMGAPPPHQPHQQQQTPPPPSPPPWSTETASPAPSYT